MAGRGVSPGNGGMVIIFFGIIIAIVALLIFAAFCLMCREKCKKKLAQRYGAVKERKWRALFKAQQLSKCLSHNFYRLSAISAELTPA